MSNDAIEVGSKWLYKESSEAPTETLTVAINNGDWVLLIEDRDDGISTSPVRFLERATRIDTPAAVRVGDVVKDPALLREGMRVEWATGVRGAWTLRNDADVANLRDGMEAIRSDGSGVDYGVRILSLPEPAKAEAPRWHAGKYCDDFRCDEYGRCICTEAEAPVTTTGSSAVEILSIKFMREEPPPPPAPPRCKEGCVPAAPCMTEGVCGYWREPMHSRVPGLRSGVSDVSPDLPAARASTYVPRHEGLAGWATRRWR